MNAETLSLLREIDQAIIKLRGVYSLWARDQGISYNEMLVFYAIREHGFCTQKQICDNYLIPRQTMNNIMARFHNAGVLEISRELSRGREKAFVLTEKGRSYAACLMQSLERVEAQAVETLGREKLQIMTESMRQYEEVLSALMEKESGSYGR